MALSRVRYKMSARPRGVAIIINNRNFTCGLEDRVGTDSNAEALTRLFIYLGFYTNRYDNLKGRDVQRRLRDIADLDHSRFDCLMVAILSHGVRGKVYATDGSLIAAEDIQSMFNGFHVPSLIGKPKIFFLSDNKMQSTKIPERLAIEADYIIAYCTLPGFVSWRNSEYGSWFIKTFVDTMFELASKEDMITILTEVNRRVAENFQSKSRNKQMPEFESSLTRRLLFNPGRYGNARSKKDDVYSMISKPRGVAIIINNHRFTCGMKDRVGSNIDAEALTRLFVHLGFHTNRYDDLKGKDFRRRLRDIADSDHSKFDCLIVTILSHGVRGKVYSSDGDLIVRKEITSYFDGETCPSLIGKPKIFILQVDRGGKFDYGAELPSEDQVSPPALPIESDFIFAYATSPQSSKFGSLSVKAFTDAMFEMVGKEQFMDILTTVSRRMAQQDSAEGISMCSSASALTRKLYFRPGSYKVPESMETEHMLQSKEEAKHLAVIEQAINRKGKLKHSSVHGVFVGPARSGKDTLLKRLLGEKEKLHEKSPSTGVAEKVVQVSVKSRSSDTFAATADNKVWTRLSALDDEAIEMMMHLASKQESVSVVEDSKTNRVDHSSSVTEMEPTVHVGSPNVANSGKNIRINQTTDTDLTVEGATAKVPELDNYKAALDVFQDALQSQDMQTLQQHLDDHWSLYLSNTGGQMEFQELLPLLTSGPSIFFVTFRLDRDLNACYEIVYESAKSELYRYRSSNTPLVNILQTLASIDASGTYSYANEKPVSTQLTYKVLLIGTHKDLLEKSLPDESSVEARIKEIDDTIQDAVKHATFFQKIEFASDDRLIFTVNNFSPEETEFKKIKAVVARTVKEGIFEITSPSHWLIYSLVLRQLKTRVETYNKCFEIAKSCGITDLEDFNAALHFIHQRMGLIRYFPQSELNDLVIIDPQVLFDKTTELIIETFTFEQVGKHVVNDFKKGIFSVTDFERISDKKDPEGLLKASKFAKILEHLRIAAPFQERGNKVLKYFFPCALSHANKSTYSLHSSIPSLVISFGCGFCPMGIGGALIKYLMTNEMQCEYEWELLTNEIYREQVSFFITGTCDTVVLKVLPTHLELQCVAPVHNVEETCDLVSRALEMGVQRVIADIHYVNTKSFFTFYCQAHECREDEPHPAKLNVSRRGQPKLSCTKEHTRISNLPRGYEVWRIVTEPSPKAILKDDSRKEISEEDKLSELPPVLTKKNLTALLNALWSVRAKWRSLGLALHFCTGDLDAIEINHPHDCETCLEKLLTKWLNQANRSLDSLRTALKCPLMQP